MIGDGCLSHCCALRWRGRMRRPAAGPALGKRDAGQAGHGLRRRPARSGDTRNTPTAARKARRAAPASAEVAVAATKAIPGGAIMLAALALPGLAPGREPPDSASSASNTSTTATSQPNLDRIHVRVARARTVAADCRRMVAARGRGVGCDFGRLAALPHRRVGGLAFRREAQGRRCRGNALLPACQRHGRRPGRPSENDYVSRFASALQASVASDDNNTTWLAGIGVAQRPHQPGQQGGRRTRQSTRIDLMLGVTRVLTPRRHRAGGA